MTDGTTAISFAYNADGRRVSKAVGGVTYNYVYAGSTLTDVTWGNNSLHFVYDALGASAVVYNGTTYYYLRNAQGDIVGIVDTSGNTVVSYAYDAWGKLLSTTGTLASTLGVYNPLRYRGYFYDTETGLYYLMSRYYNPSWGRFINADTTAVLTASPDKANWDKNLFAYCDNNPVMRKDDGGQFWHIIAGALIGGIANAAMTAICGGDLASIGVSFATGALTGGLAAAGIPFAASIAVNALCGAAESVFNDLHNGEGYSAGEVVQHAVINAGTAALFTYVSGPSTGKKMNRLYKEAQAGEKFLKAVGTTPTGNRAAKQAIGTYFTQLGRFIVREAKQAAIFNTASKAEANLP